MNKETAVAQANLNRIDQYTPQGSSTYEQIGVNEDGTPRFKQTTTLSPEQQAIYNQQAALTQQLGGIAGQSMGRVGDAMSTPFNFNGMTPMQTSISAGQYAPQTQGATPQAVQKTISGVPDVNYMQQGSAGNITNSIAGAGNIQKSVGANDFAANAKQVQDAVYGQAQSRLDPQWQQQQNDFDAKMAAMGVSNNSDAYRREYDNFMRSKTDAYNQANFSAIQAGGQEQSRLFGLDLAKGQFGNQAQAQQYAQNANNAQFGNSAQQQLFQQQLGVNTFNNSAQDQKYTQELGKADLFNNANQQAFNQQMANSSFFNQAQNQGFNQAQSAANFQNTARQNQISEASYLRNLPLSDIAALMGTAGPGMAPSFQNVAQVGVAAPDYQGLVQSNYQNALNQYNQQQAASGSMWGDIFGGLGSLAMIPLMSDRRTKTAIKRIGAYSSGIPTYTYRYKTDPANVIRFGVMAQDTLKVLPEAVHTNDNGVMAVDYRKVVAHVVR